ncbi:MAG: hypothetical protein J2P17_08435 [Mycobacterium sp.]|nr:hypothetical protein [Mycobacterium sp.]
MAVIDCPQTPECQATGGALSRAGTPATAMSGYQPPTPPDGVESARAGSHHPVASAGYAASGPTRTDQTRSLDVAGPAENNRPPSWLAPHDQVRVNP